MPGEKTTEFAIISLLTAAGIGVTVPEGINSLLRHPVEIQGDDTGVRDDASSCG